MNSPFHVKKKKKKKGEIRKGKKGGQGEICLQHFLQNDGGGKGKNKGLIGKEEGKEGIWCHWGLFHKKMKRKEMLELKGRKKKGGIINLYLII